MPKFWQQSKQRPIFVWTSGWSLRFPLLAPWTARKGTASLVTLAAWWIPSLPYQKIGLPKFGHGFVCRRVGKKNELRLAKRHLLAKNFGNMCGLVEGSFAFHSSGSPQGHRLPGRPDCLVGLETAQCGRLRQRAS